MKINVAKGALHTLISAEDKYDGLSSWPGTLELLTHCTFLNSFYTQTCLAPPLGSKWHSAQTELLI